VGCAARFSFTSKPHARVFFSPFSKTSQQKEALQCSRPKRDESAREVRGGSNDDPIKIKREGVRDIAMHAIPDMAGSQFCQAHVDEVNAQMTMLCRSRNATRNLGSVL
jgi:hypothetical protein